ncbi:MAG: ABC transporter permease subunit [Candidatus Omnitrophica bacterium]|nr:ABC transporter permease subunit [Candidatus Omnitrophota bacterium]
MKIAAIAKKELKSYFHSPMAYIVLFLTITVFNVFFYLIINENREVNLRDMFKLMEFMFVFLLPLLTMRLFSEEKATGTVEFLMTTPTSNWTIVLGKYWASVLFYSIIIISSFVYYIIMEIFAEPDRLAVLSGYFGIWLEGAFFIAIGMLASSWTKNSIIAAITSYVFILFLYFSLALEKYTTGIVTEFIRFANTLAHMENFAIGLVTTADIVYYLSGILICLILTRYSIETRIWR